MKTKNLVVLSALATLAIAIACKKEKSSGGSNDPEIETTFTLSENQAVSEALHDDVNAVFLQVAGENGLGRMGINLPNGRPNTICATVTVTPGGSTYPKTVTIDFGTGCTSDGITRKGIINVVLDGHVLANGTTAVMTFSNYYVEDFKIEGTITWTNTSTPNGISWTRSIAEGKVTAPGGNYYWLHNGTKTVQQTAGAGTPLDPTDDVYSITGNHTVENPDGASRTATITDALIKPFLCHNVTMGKVKIQGPNHFAIVDFGDGTCDRKATITIDGRPERNFLLP